MKKISLISLYLLCALWVLNPALANENLRPFPFVGQIKAENVNIRSGPHLNFEHLAKLKKDERVFVVERKNDWYKVKIPHRFSVFISSKFIEKKSDYFALVLANRVNIRTKPNTKSTVLCQVNKGDIVRLRGKREEWTRIVPPQNCFGWIKQDFVKFLKPFGREEIEKEVLEKRAEIKKITEKLTKELKPVAKSAVKPDTVDKKQEPIAKGIVGDSGRLFNRRTLHKLLDEKGNIIYYLDADKKLLDSFGNCKVSVWGEKRTNDKYTAPIIKVQKIIIIE